LLMDYLWLIKVHFLCRILSHFFVLNTNGKIQDWGHETTNTDEERRSGDKTTPADIYFIRKKGKESAFCRFSREIETLCIRCRDLF